MDKTKKNIFISHSGRDEKYIEEFKAKIGKNFEIRDSSIVETEPNNANNKEYIKYRILQPRIDWAGTMVVLIGKDTKNRDYVNWEIDYAGRCGKTIIGVYLPGATENDVPEGVNNFGDSLVPWNSQDINNVLSGEKEWKNPNGTRRPDIETRVVC